MTTPIRVELPTAMPVGTVNAYLFTDPEPLLLDTGVKSDACLTALETALNSAGLNLADLARVVISHPHIDHLGLAGTIAARSRATFHIFGPARPWLTNYRRMLTRRLTYYRQNLFPALNLPPEISRPILDYYAGIQDGADDIPPDRIITFQADETISMGGLPWRVLHTPGHAATLTCFYQPLTRQFFSTDMLLHVTPTPIVEPPPPGQTNRIPSLPQFLDSLERVADLDCRIVYPGHGPAFNDPEALIARQKERIAARKLECLALIAQGMNTVGDLLLAMYAHYPPHFRFAGLWMLIGYLDLLHLEKRIAWIEKATGTTVQLTTEEESH